MLLAMRERELGLGQGTARAHADALIRAMPPPSDYSVFQDVADVLPWHQSGVSKEQQDALLWAFKTVSGNWTPWRTVLSRGAPREPLSAYAFLSLECHYGYILKDQKLEPWRPSGDVAPLLRFRLAVCGRDWDLAALDALLKDVPRFGEVQLFLGEAAYSRGTLYTAEKHLLKAVDTIADWPAAHLALGQVYFMMEDLESARASYHRVVAAVPGQRDAMLGEVKSLSYLGRADEAIAILDEMERLGTWYLGEMHYWRAWNRNRLKQYEAADLDLAAARKYLPMDPFVDKLTGLVALARQDVPRAEREFRLAVAHFEGRKARDCDSGYYLASTLVMQKAWPEAATIFEKAEPCYALDEDALKKKIVEIQASELPDERKVRLVAAKERDIAVLRLQQGRSAFNAAVALANQGHLDKARPFADRAAAHPELKDLVQPLLARLAGK
jgi:tetratricopeptide (TPR) repeat protein